MGDHGDAPELKVDKPEKDDRHEKAKAKKKAHTVTEEDRLELLNSMQSTPEGISDEEAARRFATNGPNELPKQSVNPILRFLSFFWNPLAWAMEVAAIVSAILQDFADFALIFALLIFNAAIGFYEEKSAGNALEALRAQLAPTATVQRGPGSLKTIPARELVTGDIIHMRLGDVVPADCKLLHGAPCKCDQASLTGESLPVTKFFGDEMFSGAAIKEGEVEAVVIATGVNTFFGKAATLVEGTQQEGHLQQVLTYIGAFCIGYITIFVTLEIIIEFAVRDFPCSSVDDCSTLENCLVLIIGGIPIAMPTVLSVTMALGAGQLAKKKAIVSRLTAIEELAGMDILCSDKTGTLTLNKLTIGDPVTFAGRSQDDVILHGVLAARFDKPEHLDPIDSAVVTSAPAHIKEIVAKYKVVTHLPFEPVGKKTKAHVQHTDGTHYWVSKGAPVQVLSVCTANKDQVHASVHENIEDYAGRGYRVLAVASKPSTGDEDLDGEDEGWTFEGLLPMFDPPRTDTKETVRLVKSMGCGVKMITGDHLAIAKDTGAKLGIGSNMFTTSVLEENHGGDATVNKNKLLLIEGADGFAEVFPEHKYDIVAVLQQGGHIIGMTGDGVNDAPALKKADIGIAVAGATDAARAASDIILTEAGLGVIVFAVIGSRKIFQRMKNYATYSVTTCVRIVTTFGLLTLIYGFEFPTLLIVILAILNDGTMITISKDRARPSPRPDEWKLSHLFFKAFVFGLYLTATTMILFAVAHNTRFFRNQLDILILGEDKLRAMIYLHVSISGSAIILVTRSVKFSYCERPGLALLGALVMSQTIATIIGIFGFNGYPHDGHTDFVGCGGAYAIVCWVWAIFCYLLLDPIKICIEWILLRPTVSAITGDKRQSKRKSALIEHNKKAQQFA